MVFPLRLDVPTSAFDLSAAGLSSHDAVNKRNIANKNAGIVACLTHEGAGAFHKGSLTLSEKGQELLQALDATKCRRKSCGNSLCEQWASRYGRNRFQKKKRLTEEEAFSRVFAFRYPALSYDECHDAVRRKVLPYREQWSVDSYIMRGYCSYECMKAQQRAYATHGGPLSDSEKKRLHNEDFKLSNRYRRDEAAAWERWSNIVSITVIPTDEGRDILVHGCAMDTGFAGRKVTRRFQLLQTFRGEGDLQRAIAFAVALPSEQDLEAEIRQENLPQGIERETLDAGVAFLHATIAQEEAAIKDLTEKLQASLKETVGVSGAKRLAACTAATELFVAVRLKRGMLGKLNSMIEDFDKRLTGKDSECNSPVPWSTTMSVRDASATLPTWLRDAMNGW